MKVMPDPSLANDNPENSEAQRLVGAFLQRWALVEFCLDQALGAALGLKQQQTNIIAVNIPFYKKVHITNAALDFLQLRPSEVKRRKKEIEKLRPLANDRNIAAHYGFEPNENGDGVRFFYLKAEGRLEWPETIWSVQEFREKFRNMTTAIEVLNNVEKLAHGRHIGNSLINALMRKRDAAFGELTGIPGLPGMPGLLSGFNPSGGLDQAEGSLPAVPPFDPKRSKS